METLVVLILTLLPTLIWSWRIERGGTISSASTHVSLEQQQQAWQNERRRPPNISDPDYFHPTSSGGRAHRPGRDGAVVFIAKVHATSSDPTQFETVDVPPLELRAHYFLKENVVQQYVVPGDSRRSPYQQEVRVKVWGGGGGGCDGGRGETEEPLPEEYESSNGTILHKFSEGSGGGYVESTFRLSVGDTLQVVVGGGGSSSQSLPDSLGGKGGYNGGLPGREDATSGGGGGGGLTSVSLSNGTVIAAAYGGDGGGNTTYCTALGGFGGSLKNELKHKHIGGYINFDLALPDSDNDNVSDEEQVEVICPGVPTIGMLSHDSARFTWNAGSHQKETSKELYVQKYTVQLSGGSTTDGETGKEIDIDCSEAYYKLHEHIRRSIYVAQNATTELDGFLTPSTRYCLRVEAFSIENLSLGVQFLPFATKAAPVNKWLPVAVRHLGTSTIAEAAVASGSAAADSSHAESSVHSWCEDSTTQPTGRRGHSMTIINDQVYIFGGATLKCVCEYNATREEKVCSSKNVYSNELWHFEPRTAMFTRLRSEFEDEPWPRGREQHSATALPDGSTIVIGGMTSSSSDDGNDELQLIGEDPELLADAWRLRDPHHISSHVYSSSSMGDDMPLELMPGHITSHQISMSPNDVDEDLLSGQDNNMCIHDMSVKISLDHSCVKGIEYIKVTGPGIMGVPGEAHQSGDYETKIFVSSIKSRGNECQSLSLNLLFSDNADESILSHASIPDSGTFRPASSLMSTFGGLPITNEGEWKISIALLQPIHPEDHQGNLLSWEMNIDTKPCVPYAKWEKLPMPPSSFSPRRLHTAVAVDGSIFTMGGFAERQLSDLWRYNHDSSSWTELNNAALRGQWPLNGQVAYLGQFGVLAYGGIAKYGPQKQGHDLSLLDLFKDEWEHVPIPEHGDGFNNDIPYGRYLSSIGVLNNVDGIYKSYNIDGQGPMALVFGGDGGLLHNTYPDSYGFLPNTFYDDVWLLSPGRVHISSTMYQRRRADYCDWQWIPGSTSFQVWTATCGWDSFMGGSPGECRLENILIAAWCRQQFQSFYMS